MELIKSKTEFADKFKQISYDYSNLRARHFATTAMMLLASLGLSACGGGSAPAAGSANTSGNTSNGGTQTDQTDSGSSTQDDAAVDDTAGLGIGGGGGGGGGGGVVLPAVGNTLSIFKSGTSYANSSVSGISQVGTAAYYRVSNAASNEYDISLNADGSGILTFEFDDASDVITLDSGSSISGFTQLKVINGTIDVSEANLGSVNYISVASSVKLTASQFLGLETVIINSSSGGIVLEVRTQAEVNQINSALANGTIDLFSPGDLLTITASAGSALTSEQIQAASTGINSSKKPLSSIDVTEFSEILTPLVAASGATVSIENNDQYINKADSSNLIKFYVDEPAGYAVRTVTVGGQNLQLSDGAYTLNAASLSDGTHSVTVTLELENVPSGLSDFSENLITLTSEIVLDRTAPSTPTITILGEGNGFNAAEVATPRAINVATELGSEVVSIKLNETSLQSSGGTYFLDASALADGDYTLDIVISDNAGNRTTTSHEFTVDLDALQEAAITITGNDFLLSNAEATGNYTINVDTLGAANLISAKFNNTQIALSGGTSYTIDASSLATGTYQFEVITADLSGNQMVSTKTLLIDRVAPADALIRIPGSNNALTASERSTFLDFTVTPQAGADAVSAYFGAIQLDEVAENIFRLSEANASGLPGGFKTLSVASEDLAGNQTVTQVDVMVVGNSSNLAQMFEFNATKENDIMTVDAYIKNFRSDLGEGIPSSSFWIDLNGAQADYIEGSYRMRAEGAFHLRALENGSKGEIFSAAAFANSWSDFSKPYFSFQADVGALTSIDISFKDFMVYTTDLGDFSTTIIA